MNIQVLLLTIGIPFWVMGWAMAFAMLAIERNFYLAWLFFGIGCVAALLTAIGNSL